MSMRGILVSVVIVTTAALVIVSSADSNTDSEDGKVVGYEELYARQRQEFEHPLEYENAEEARKDTLSYEELYQRQVREFVNPLGYEDRRTDPANNIDNTAGRHGTSIGRDKFRRKRALTGSDPFSVIAGISGGSVVHTDKDNISSALGLLTSVTLPSSVLITKWSLVVSLYWNGTAHVDQSVYNLAVEVQTSCCTPMLKIFDPTGKLVTGSDPNVTVTTNTSTLYHIRIGQPTVGVWTLQVDDVRNQTYDISIRGSSLIAFDASSVDVNGTSITGQPETGSNSTYMKVVPDGGNLVSNWTYLVVKATNGTVLQRIAMGRPKGSRTLRWYIIPVVWPNNDVYVGVEGLDKAGDVFTREQTTMVLPSGVRLTLMNPELEYIRTCRFPSVLRYTVKDVGLAADFTATVLIDTSNFEATVTPSYFHLNSLMSQEFNCTVTLYSKLYHDIVGNVNIQIVASDGQIQYLQHNLIAKDLDCRTNTSITTPPPPSSSSRISAGTVTVFTISSLFMAGMWMFRP